MTPSFLSRRNTPIPRGRTARWSSRRGVMVLTVMFMVIVAVLLGAFVLNWAHLIVVQRTLSGRADAIALAGAPSLLDQNLLMDLPADPSQTIADALTVADQFRLANNAGGSNTYLVSAADLMLTPGHAIDPTLPMTAGNFDPATPYDVLRIDIHRTTATGHPVTQLVTGTWNALGTDVTATSFAKVDNRLVGFRPTSKINSPVVPIAIEENAFATGRTSDSNGNSILELEVRLACTNAGLATANGVVIGFDGPPVQAQVASQIVQGVSPSDLPGPDHWLGPITTSTPQDFSGTSPLGGGFCATVENALTLIALPGGGVRVVFPIYDKTASGGGMYSLIGFVAAKVLSVSSDADQVKFVIEPCYLVHTTAWIDDSISVLNPYIYKLSLAR